MMKNRIHCVWWFAVLLFGMGCLFGLPASAQEEGHGNVLVITSYNPETRKMYENLSDFMDQFKQRGGQLDRVWIENMNCKNLSDAYLWKDRMRDILTRYCRSHRPSLIVLLGQEAWAAYLSQTSNLARKTPVLCGLVSTNTVELPNDSTDLQHWDPQSKSIFVDYGHFNIVGGVFYRYDVERNIQLVRKFYPEVDTLAFLSDNSFGGILMQSLFKKETLRFPDLNIKWLDGRQRTLMQVSEELSHMNDARHCLMVGTWRIDSSDNYVMANTTYVLRDANPHLPVFTLASTGLGHWALGGYVPEYFIMGHRLADMVCDYLSTGKTETYISPCHYTFDVERVKAFGKQSIQLPDDAVLINEHPAFYEEHMPLLLGILASLILMAFALVLSLRHIRRMNKLQESLEHQSQELLLAKDKAEESNRLKTAFLANMSHEIRTPLNAIVGFSELLAAGDVEDEESRLLYGGIIRKNSDLLLHLVNDILDLSRIESGRIKMVYDTCEVVELCRMALLTVEQTRRTEARYESNFPVDSLFLNTDSQRLKQVIINLLTNASKFTKAGFIRLSFQIDQERRLVEFSVTDTGCGIPAEKMERVFERFEKLNENAQGVGLGLSICRLIVEKLGGRIWVDREYTQGARFVFTHPLTVLQE